METIDKEVNSNLELITYINDLMENGWELLDVQSKFFAINSNILCFLFIKNGEVISIKFETLKFESLKFESEKRYHLKIEQIS